MALSGSQVTQFGVSGYTQIPYSSFAGKAVRAFTNVTIGAAPYRATDLVASSRSPELMAMARDTTLVVKKLRWVQ